MQSNRAEGTRPEAQLRKALWAAGLRGYRKNVRALPGKPDVVFTVPKVVVFVHGCFWHSCPACYDSRWREPKTNAEYWSEKLRRNIERDKENAERLQAMGFEVMVVWEHELKKDLNKAVESVRSKVLTRRLEPEPKP